MPVPDSSLRLQGETDLFARPAACKRRNLHLCCARRLAASLSRLASSATAGFAAAPGKSIRACGPPWVLPVAPFHPACSRMLAASVHNSFTKHSKKVNHFFAALWYDNIVRRNADILPLSFLRIGVRRTRTAAPNHMHRSSRSVQTPPIRAAFLLFRKSRRAFSCSFYMP